MVKILAFDTTNEFMSVAISENSHILAYKIIKEADKQSQFLVSTIEELLGELRIWYKDLNALALTIGPGSFTGVRVGMSVAKGIKVATSLKIICVSCFEALGFPYRFNDGTKLSTNTKICVVMDARQNNLFIQVFDSNCLAITEPKIIKKDEIVNLMQDILENNCNGNNEFLLIGSGKNIAKKILLDDFRPGLKKNLSIDISKNDDVLDAKNVALLGYEKFEKSEFCDEINPLYLRPPRICKKTEKKLKKVSNNINL